MIIGQGNVALDVARILSKTVDELKSTDIAQHTLDALATSKIKEVHVIGRRGPAQAAFTPVEIREFKELEDCQAVISSEDLQLNFASQTELEDTSNAQKKKNYGILKEIAELPKANKSKKCTFHFRKSPAAIYGDDTGHLNRIYLEKNELTGEPGKQKAKGTGEKVELKCGLIFRSIGYRGVPIKGLPFHDQWGIIPNDQGRIADSEALFPGLYTAGWIKRGPSGIIGTNKPDAVETIEHLLSDVKTLNPCKNPDNKLLLALLKELKINYITFEDWKIIDQKEIENGAAVGKPREKFVSIDQMLSIVGKK